ncbi:MAG: hypothetical protein M3Q34_03415 [bacterium]|nr:hypothetical protein [bacterium]
MADKKPAPGGDHGGFFSSIPKEFWIFLIISIPTYFLWQYNSRLLILFISTFVVSRIAWKVWVHYVQQDFLSGIDYVLLEIVPPREVLRNPRAMELFFTNALYHWSNKGGIEAYWQGAVWFFYSLEIVSIDGQVHFYIRTPTRLKEMIETQMYAQYPQAQVRVAEDYTAAVDEITEDGKWKLWGCEWKLEKPEAYPIKTYVDFGLDKDPKEEYKIDPISPVIELFGSLKKGEQMWCQIVIRPTKKEFHEHGTWFGSHDWVKESEEQLKLILKPYTQVKDSGAVEIRAPDFLRPVVEGVTNKMTKIGFDTGIRTIYVATKEAWSMNSRRNIRLIFRQYSKPLLNSIVRHNATQADSLGGGGFVGSFFMLPGKTVTRLQDRMLLEYRERAFFYHPLRQQLFNEHSLPWPISPWLFPAYFHSVFYVLSVEELATIWHFPGQILKVPTLERIESKEAAPPTNLPS